MSFSYCLSGGGQTSIFPDTCDVQEQKFYTQHAILLNCPQISGLCDKKYLNKWKVKMFVDTFAQSKESI